MRVKAVIDLKKFEENLDIISKKVDKKKIMAIIKADAYGHGAKRIFLKCLDYGINFFGVATEQEAKKLLKINNKANILILSPVEKKKIKELANLGLHLTISNFEDIEYILKENIKGNFHLAFDTGMGRIGFDRYNIKKAIEMLKPIGIFSHLSFANNEKSSLKQKQIFDEVVKKYDIKYKHLLNSIGFMKYFSDEYDLYRVGIILYGLEHKSFKPVMSLYARVNNVKKLNEDTNIGYNNTYKAKKGDIIATISAGYADGINRALSNKGKVYFKGKLYNIIGNICMDQFMILADENIKVNDYVEIFGENIGVDNLAKQLNTISYEVFCNISNRVKEYIRRKKMIIDILFLLIVLIFVLLGLKNGFIKEVLKLLSLIITIYLAGKVLDIARTYYDFKIQNKYVLYFISFIITYIVVSIVFSLISSFLDKTNFGIINKLLGAILGLIKASILIFVIFIACLFLSEHSKEIKNELKESISSKYISIYLNEYRTIFPEFIQNKLDKYRKSQLLKDYKEKILKDFSKGVF